MPLLWTEENICIVLPYFSYWLTPSFVLAQTLCAWAQYERCACPCRQVTKLPADCCPCELCVVKWGWSRARRCESCEPTVQAVWHSTCTIRPFTGNRNLSLVAWQWPCSDSQRYNTGSSGSLVLWCLWQEKPKSTHLNPLTQTDTFPQLQLHDTRPGSWLCCPVRRTSQRGRSADMVSSDGEYAAADRKVSRCPHVHCSEKSQTFPDGQTLKWTRALTLSLTKRKQRSSGVTGPPQPPEFPSKHRGTHSLSTQISSPSVESPVSHQDQGPFFIEINMGDGG